MPDASPSSPPINLEDLEIRVIPEKFYGAGLKAAIPEKKPDPLPPMPPAPHVSRLPIYIVIGLLVLIIGGGFVYFNRALLFPQPTPPTAPIVVETPPPPPVPSAPTDLAATSTNPQSVQLRWADTSSNEDGFRIERHAGNGAFASVTTLPANSTSFLDLSVQPATTYTYRVSALNVSGESQKSNEAGVTVPPLPPPPPEAPKLPPAGLDTDSDGLTDVEEGLYGTEARTPDADKDGFLDGNEVFHLYNPAGQAPIRLLDSSLVKIINAQVGWVMSIPASWAFTWKTPDGTRAVIDSKHGEVFNVSVENNPDKKPLLEWYLERNPGVTSSQVLQYRSKGGYEGIIGKDLLTTYIPWGGHVFVFAYDLGGQPFINYRTTYSMMLNSLQLSGLPHVSPPVPGAPLPFEPSATTSGEIQQPIPVGSPTSSTSSQP